MTTETLVALVKATGQDLIDQAEDLVGDITLTTDFSINLNFPMDGAAIPTIDVYKTLVGKNVVDAISKSKE